MSLEPTRMLYTSVDFTPASVRSHRAARAGRRRLAITATVLTLLAVLIVGQGMAWRSHLVAKHANLASVEASLAWQLDQSAELDRQYSRLVRQLAVAELAADSVTTTHVTAEIAAALPSDAALVALAIDRTYLTTTQRAGERVVERTHPAFEIDMRVAVNEAEPAMTVANFAARLAEGDLFEHVTVEAAEPGDRDAVYRVRATVVLPDGVVDQHGGEVAHGG